jgi:hypothetical protein
MGTAMTSEPAAAIQTPWDKPGRFWRGNLHTHSTLSDGHRSPAEVCRFYAEAGYDFLSLTDHFIERFGWPIADTAAFATETFATIPGAEIHPLRDTMELGQPWHLVAVGLAADFAPTADDETGPALAARALAAGAWVAAAHPQWFAMTEADMLALGPVHAVEIFNASCGDDNDTAESTSMLDQMLCRGRRVQACATDDAHFVANSHDRAGGWVMVRAERNDPDALLAALKAGAYYASSGPEILGLEVVPGERLRVRCSPAERVFLIGGPARYAAVGERGVTEAEFDLSGWRDPFARVVVRDAAGRKAWSNPVWFEEDESASA